MRNFCCNCTTTLMCYLLIMSVIDFTESWWMMAQMSAASSKFSSPNYCDAIPGLSRLQRKLCSENPSATRVLHRGLRDAVDECRHQFATERWNCSVADGAFGLALKVASAEVAFLYAITAAGASRALARECAKGTLPDCSCGDVPNEKRVVPLAYHSLPLPYANSTMVTQQQASYYYQSNYQSLVSSADGSKKLSAQMLPNNEFTWAGCSDNVRYGNRFGRSFIDRTEKQHSDARALMNLHNNRVGRKVLSANQRRQCKCHGVSGSCVTKTCWSVVPTFNELGTIFKRKYNQAHQVIVGPNSNDLYEVESRESKKYANIHRSQRESLEKPYLTYNTFTTKAAKRGDLVFLEMSPDYCTVDERSDVSGTANRECFTEAECDHLCCGRGWRMLREFRQEPCRCTFVWCCDVKCDTCVEPVERRFCN